MTSGCTFDLTTFRAGLRAKLKVTRKTEAEILNQAGGSICANAIRLTKKASKADIQAALQTNGLAFKLLQSPSYQRRLPRSLQGFTRGKHTRPELNAAARRLIQLRVSSRRYIAAGWRKPLAVFRPGSQGRVSEKGYAARSKATRATPSSLVATFENHATGAATIGAPALQEAFDNEGRAMKKYGEQALAAAWR